MEQWNDRARPCRRSLNRAVSTEDPEQSFRTGDSHLAQVLPPPLSSDLAALRLSSAGRSMTVDELQAALKGRGVAMLLLLLALPFCLVPVPGLSTPFGLAVLQKPWLPKFIRQRRISAARLVKVLTGGIRFAKLMEKVVKPRMHFLHSWPGAMNLIGLGIAAGSCCSYCRFRFLSATWCLRGQ